MSFDITNVYKTTLAVANMALPMFVNKLSYLMTGNYGLDKEWMNKTYQFGDTMNIRRQLRSHTQDGQAAVPQPILERVTPLTINHQYNDFFQYSAKDLTLNMPNERKAFAQRYLAPKINALVSRMESDIVQQSLTQIWMYTGGINSPINTYQRLDDGSIVLREMGVPDDNLYQGISLRDGGLLRAAYTNNFSMALNDGVNKRARLGHLGFFDIFENQANSFKFQSNLSAGQTATLTANVLNGATTVALTGLPATTVIKAGDRFYFNTHYRINNLNYNTVSTNFQCVVLANATTSGGGAVTLTVSPDLTWAPTLTEPDTTVVPNPIQNLDTQPLSGDTVTFLGGAVTPNIAYAKDALTIACPLIEPLDTPYSAVARHKDLPIGIRVSRIGDIQASVNLMRIDVLAGFLWHGEYAAFNFS